MPLPRRSPRSTPRASTTVVPRSLQPLLQQARQTISDQQQAITTLQANMAALTQHTRQRGARPSVNPTARTANPAPTNPAGRSTNHDTRTSLNPHPTSATPRTQEADSCSSSSSILNVLCLSNHHLLTTMHVHALL
ncbi:hypothetical protein O3P69_010436 [Scylla paramamosain]|uniref:Uncharacterized protein n=1 Tax=Scylla paramamosain TaxID=85552 RepID=A0AAW0TUI1_SCYPA